MMQVWLRYMKCLICCLTFCNSRVKEDLLGERAVILALLFIVRNVFLDDFFGKQHDPYNGEENGKTVIEFFFFAANVCTFEPVTD